MAYARERLGMAVTQARGALNLKANQPVTVVSIHVRRQDYAHHMDALYKEGLASRDYFVRAINYFRHRLKGQIHSLLVNKVTCRQYKVGGKGFACPSKKEEECMQLFGGGQQGGRTIQR